MMALRIYILLFLSVVLFFDYSFAQTNGGINTITKDSIEQTDLKYRKNDKLRKRYINIGVSYDELQIENLTKIYSNVGAFLSVGKTYSLHKKPIGGVLRFGIDATWFELNYSDYKVSLNDIQGVRNIAYQKAEVSMQVGPSIILNPIRQFNIHCYVRYVPSFSAVLENMKLMYGNYASVFIGGLSVSYGIFGVGVEKRIGDVVYDYMYPEVVYGMPKKVASSFEGYRAYITFKF